MPRRIEDRGPETRDPTPSDGFEEFSMRVLDVVDDVPRGRVVTYGDIAAHLGSGPRRVARVMSKRGDEVPWWRVLRADGTPAPEVAVEQLRRLRSERTPMHPDGSRVQLSVCRWPIAGTDDRT